MSQASTRRFQTAGWPSPSEISAPVHPLATDLPESKIVAVWQAGMDLPDVIPLWVGESDMNTPEFICKAAYDAMQQGYTRYPPKRGIPELRQAIASYQNRLYGTDTDIGRITVTSSGMAAILLTAEAVLGTGDNMVVISPVWPNALAVAHLMGAETREVYLTPPAHEGDHRFRLELDKLYAQVDARTRIIFACSPSNPTGWLMPEEQRAELVAFCRERGIWLISDEVYNRITYDGKPAPSVLNHIDDNDPVIVVNSFSKAWAMTGWRLGWLTHPMAMGPVYDKLIEYNTSGAPPFVQYGGLAAIEHGEGFIAEMVEHCRKGRDVVVRRLGPLDRLTLAEPDAAFYAFFHVEGVDDDLAFALKILHDCKVGLAPGSAFGHGGAGYLRLCFAVSDDKLEEACDRMLPLLT